jgi:exonuclease III
MNRLNFKAATYNIWHESYEAEGGIVHSPIRYDRIAALLGDQFDLIAIQEISRAAFDSIGKELKGYWSVFQPHPNRPDGVAIFAKANVFDWLKTEAIEIPRGDSKSGLLIKLAHKSAGKIVSIATSHFKGGHYPDRAAGDLECEAVAYALNQADGNLKILAGDFNQGSKEQQNNRVSNIKQRYGFQEETQNEYDTDPCNGRRIDFLLYKTDHETEVALATAPPRIVAPFLEAEVSDHLPFIQEFQFLRAAPRENGPPGDSPDEPLEPITQEQQIGTGPVAGASNLNAPPVAQDDRIPDANRIQIQQDAEDQSVQPKPSKPLG